ncbi:MAG: hypothetical protein OXI15_14665 [Chromatiales bacterium]|nr:hypothetical protein [Chromatiales bacterium]
MADDPSQTPPTRDRDESPDETQSYLAGLTFEETFHVGQSLGRVLERLDTQAKRLDDLNTTFKETDEKVSRLVREFGFIKKAWWIGLLALGFVLAKLTDYLPILFSQPSG